MSSNEEQLASLYVKIDTLLALMYPDEFKEKGTVSFKKGIFKGITANLHDICIIDFDLSFVKQHPFFKNSYSETIETIKTNFNYKADRRRLYINNGAWHYKFEDTSEGIEQKAAHIVFAFELALKTIQQHLTLSL